MDLSRRLLLCAALLLGCIARGKAELQYVFSSPAMLVSGEGGKVCVNIANSEEKLDLTVVLQREGKNTTIIEEDVESPTYFQCADYEIPTESKATMVYIFFAAIGKEKSFRERKTVVIEPSKSNCMFQMDKPIYKPGQRVNCRIVCLNSQLKSFNEKFPAIYLQDPSNTKIAQWLHTETTRGVMSFSFQLIDDAPPGSYSFVAERESTYPLHQWFTVEQYVIPRFSWNVDAPNTLSVLDEQMPFNVSGTYTYGEPLAGTVVVKYCKQPISYGRRQNCFKEKGEVCSSITGKLGPEGYYSGTIDMYDRAMGSVGRSMRIEATVIEEGTGMQVTENHYVWITSQPARVSFDYDAMKEHYKRRIPYLVVATLRDEENRPMPDQQIDIDLDGTTIHTVTTDENGQIEYGIDTYDMVAPNFTVKISYRNEDQCYYAEWRDTDYPSAEYTVYRFYSESGSFLQAKHPSEELSCGQEAHFEVDYIMSPDGVGEKATTFTLYSLVMSKSKIAYSAKQEVEMSSSMNGTISVTIPVTADMSPRADWILYSVLNEELIVDTLSFSVKSCFKNQVDMAFSAEKGMPGANVEVLLSADPESICGLKMIDYGLVLLNPYDSFSAEHVLNSLGSWYSGYHVAGFDLEEPAPPCEDPNKLVFFKGNYYVPVSSDTEGDSYQKLKEVGLVIGTSAQTRKPVVCDPNARNQFPHPVFPGVMLKNGGGGYSGKAYAEDGASASLARSAAPATISTVRSDFSDTFMWSMVTLDEQGHASVIEKSPDSVTKWQGTAFCLSDKGGFGMTKHAVNYTAYLPFFVELTMPYSIIRGEILALRAVAHNYLEKCIKVQVEMASSDAYTAEPKKGEQDACICDNQKAAMLWEINAKVLGEITFKVTAKTTFIGDSCDGPSDDTQPLREDTVQRTIMVEPEGIAQERTLSNLVFVSNTRSVIPVHITPPESVVQDSMSVHVAAVGDIFGLRIRNLDDLVHKPYGCAEQNMARMAVIPYAMDYLNATDQLSDETLERGKNYLTAGYYRQLGYADGYAYKMFPNYREQPNSWMTAQVFKTFEAAKKYIYIDENRQQQTLNWLGNTQNLETGCLSAKGSPMLHQDSDNDLHYTAYCAIALMESNYSLGMNILDGAMRCLKNATTTDQKLADEVLMVYAFTMAGLSEYRDPLMKKLMKKAITENDGTIHWEREDMPKMPPVPFFFPRYPTNEVLLTGYMLLSMAAGPNPSEKDLTTMSQISMWLTRQQNSHGGFSSTPDTMVCIQALSAMAKLLFTPNSQQQVRVKSGNGEIAKFDLNPENRLVVNRSPLPNAIRDYSIEVEGNGWCMVQTVVKYNIPVPKENSAYSLALSASSDYCLQGVASTYNLSVSVSYNGNKKNVSGMTLVQIRMLSGYHPDTSSLRQLVEDGVISKAQENPKGELEIYLDSVPREGKTFKFRALMGQRVMKVKSSCGVVYDYYQPVENGMASYAHPCEENKVPVIKGVKGVKGVKGKK